MAANNLPEKSMALLTWHPRLALNANSMPGSMTAKINGKRPEAGLAWNGSVMAAMQASSTAVPTTCKIYMYRPMKVGCIGV